MFQKASDIADFLHSVDRKSCAVLKSDVTQGYIAAYPADALHNIFAVVYRDFLVDKFGVVLCGNGI